ncbi:reverse transcriptase [Cucumis melo var. makuwa]|uniref:Reverse transcriptase n=1 Tax=Cucumis melo var. makuwa TaxID=1194695 RepID=A0A5A7VJ14_CUCMM|nr:reverse transcriptase [Cucumis melo var. makuwa]TYJ97451.1 reverse transcriptase [Cucumis melo var. makuwa]
MSSSNLSPKFKAFTTSLDTATVSKNIYEAMESHGWNTALMKEMGAFEKNKTWDLCTLPEGDKTVECKWIPSLDLPPPSRGSTSDFLDSWTGTNEALGCTIFFLRFFLIQETWLVGRMVSWRMNSRGAVRAKGMKGMGLETFKRCLEVENVKQYSIDKMSRRDDCITT